MLVLPPELNYQSPSLQHPQVLGLSFRARELVLAPAGLAPVPAAGVENADLSRLVRSHTDYVARLPNILALLSLDDACAV